MFAALRHLLHRHLVLLRVELGAIAREALTLLVGGVVVVSLLTGVVLLLLGALIVATGDLLYGSPYLGVGLLISILLGLAAWIPVVLLGIDRGRRARRWAILPALLVTTLIAIGGLLAGLPEPTATGIATISGMTAFALALAVSLRRLDWAAIGDRFYPHLSEMELRRTLAEAEALIGGRPTGKDDHHG